MSSANFGGVSSAVQAGPSKSQHIKGLAAGYVGTTSTKRYKYKGFHQRIQSIRIHFRSLLEQHEQSHEDQIKAARIAAANMFARPASAAGAAAPSEAFSSAELSTQDAKGQHSYFLAALESFSQTNLHLHYLTFLAEIKSLVVSFPILLRNKDKIVSILLKHAAVPGSEARNEIFSLISVLARDLRGEFLPYFGVSMKALLALLDPSDAACVQSVFQTLAALFRYTAKQLCLSTPTTAGGVHPIVKIFNEHFEELLSHHKNYIRHFASESLAYLLRVSQRYNTSSNEYSTDRILLSLFQFHAHRNTPEFREGIAATIFETLKNIQFQFQASHMNHLHLLHHKLLRGGGAKASQVEADYHLDILMKVHRRMANYTRKEYCGQVWTGLIQHMEEIQQKLISPSAPLPVEKQQMHQREAWKLLQIIGIWMQHRHGTRIPSVEVAKKVLTLAFGPLFSTSSSSGSAAAPTLNIEWRKNAASILAKYWRDQKYQGTLNPSVPLTRFLEQLLTLESKDEPFVIEQATLMLSFLESIRDMQQDLLAPLSKGIMPIVERLFEIHERGTKVDVKTRQTAQSLGLALLMELHGVHPTGSAYAIQPLEDLVRPMQAVSATAALRALRKKQKQARDNTVAGGEDDDEADADDGAIQVDGDDANTTAATAEEDEDDVEEEVDASAYQSPLPQPSLYTCSAIMFQQLRPSEAISKYLLQQLVAVFQQALFDKDHVQNNATSDHDDEHPATTLLIASVPLSQRIATIWCILQLVPTCGLDLTQPLPPPAASGQEKRAAARTLKDVLFGLNKQLTETIQSNQTVIAANTQFIASTPIDSNVSSGDEAASHSETNNHLLVAHQKMDQLIFLRAQVVSSIAQLLKLRYSSSLQQDLFSSSESSLSAKHAPSSPALDLVRELATSTIEMFQQLPTHVANVVALDRVFETCKHLQINGIVSQVSEHSSSTSDDSNKTPSKKKKTNVPAASSSSGVTKVDNKELESFLHTLFSAASFSALSPSFLSNLSSAHAFLRTTSISVLRYFTTLRFQNDTTSADGDTDMSTGEAEAEKVNNHSEFVGDCPLLQLMHDMSVLDATLEFEKEFVRVLKQVEVLVNSKRVPELYMKLLPSFFLGLLHIKFNPLWTHVQKILNTTFVMKYCITVERQRWVWEQVLKKKLEEIKARTQLLIKESVDESEGDENAMTDADDALFSKHHARAEKKQKSASSPSTPSSTLVCAPFHSPVLMRFSHFVSFTSRSTDSFTYQTLLYATFSLDTSQVPVNGFSRRLFDKSSIQTELIEDFLAGVWQKEFLLCYPNTQRIEEGMADDERFDLDAATAANDDLTEDDEEFFERACASSTLPVPKGFTLRSGARKLVKQKLILFLKLFQACFHKASKLPHTNELKNILLTLLSNQEEELQKLSVSCLAKYQLPYLNPYISTLNSLIAESTWRETMTNFNLAPEGGMIAREHRLPFAAILIRILFPRLTHRHSGKGSRVSGLAARRAAVLGFMGGLAHEELQHLIAMIMGGSFRKIVNVVVAQTNAPAASSNSKTQSKKKPTAEASASAVKPAVHTSASQITFEDILSRQIPQLSISASSNLLEQALLNPALYAPNSKLLIPTSKQLGFLHMLQFFLSKLKSLSMPYLHLFMLQCCYMIMNAEIQIERRKGQMKKLVEEEEKDRQAQLSKENQEKKKATQKEDGSDSDNDDDPEHHASDDDEDEAAEAEEAEEPEESKEESETKTNEDEDELVLPDPDEEPVQRRKSASKSSSSDSIPYIQKKYLSELREIRQLAFSRLATILEQYPQLFRPDSLATFSDLAPPKGLQEEEQRLKYSGSSLVAYVKFFLSVSFPSIARLSNEGTQHLGGLWQSLSALSSHHYLLVHYFSDLSVVQLKWSDAVNMKGLQLKLLSASQLLAPASLHKPSSQKSPSSQSFPLFHLMLDSLAARSVQSTVVGALLTIMENLLRAREDANLWAETKNEMEIIEAERQAKQAASSSKKRKPLGMSRKMRDESSDEDAAMDESDEEDEDIRRRNARLVQIETLYLNTSSHAQRARQFFLSHFSSSFDSLWATNINHILNGMHVWISHLQLQHKDANMRGDRTPQLPTGMVVKKNPALSEKKRGGRHRVTAFFPRRELELLSQIAPFAKESGEKSIGLLIQLLIPFVHSPEKQAFTLNLHADHKKKSMSATQLLTGVPTSADRERNKAAPTLHYSLLKIMQSLVPLLRNTDQLQDIMNHMFKLLYELKSSTHRTLLVELYELLSGKTTEEPAIKGKSAAPWIVQQQSFNYLPLLSTIVSELNAMNTGRISEYDDLRRLEMYNTLDAAFSLKSIDLEIACLQKHAKSSSRMSDENQSSESIQEQLVALKTRKQELLQQSSLASENRSFSVQTFDSFFADYFSAQPENAARGISVLRALLYNVSHDLLDDDLGTRSSASNLLKKLIQFLSFPYPTQVKVNDSALFDMDTSPFEMKPGRVATPPSLLTGLFYPILKKSLKHPVDKIRREVVINLRELIITFPKFYRSFVILVDIDSEKDFLENIVSIQLHARRRALVRLFQRITVQDENDPNIFHASSDKQVDLQVIHHVLLPLLHHFIYDPAASHNVSANSAVAHVAFDSAHSGTMSNAKLAQKAAQEGSLLEESLRLAGKLSAYMPWSSWFHQVQTYLKLITARPQLERTIVRLVCNFVKEWHFEVEETAEEKQAVKEEEMRRVRAEKKLKQQEERDRRQRERQLRGELEGYEEEEQDDQDAKMSDVPSAAAAALSHSTEATPLAHRVRQSLTRRLLPQLHGLLTGHKIKAARKKDPTKGMATTYENQTELTSMSGMMNEERDTSKGLELVRVPVAMAMVGLLIRLPAALFQQEFPRLLTKLTMQLTHREQQARDLTRSTLMEILTMLGPFYYHFFVEELSRHLVNGYQLHVLGNVIWASLDTLVNKLKITPGSIDHSLPKLMDILMNDLLGEPAKQKEVAAIRAQTKEARINHAADSFQLIAQVVSFPSSIHHLIDPFRFKLAHDPTLRLRELTTLADTLKKIALGLFDNASVKGNISDMLIYIHVYLFRNATSSFQQLFPSMSDKGKLSKQDKKATSAKKNRYRALDMTAALNPMDAIREENKMRSEGKKVHGGGLAQRKAMEFVLAMQSSVANTSDFERSAARAKPSKAETFLLVQPTPERQSFQTSGSAISVGHHSNLILVFGLNLLYLALKTKSIPTGPVVNVPVGTDPTSIQAAIAESRSKLSETEIDNLRRLDPFLQLIRDYCLVMGSDLSKDALAATRSTVTKEGEKKTKSVAIATSSTAVILVALKCSEYLLQMSNLPSLNSYLRDLCNYMFGLIHSKASPSVLAVCYRNLSVILRIADWKACGISAEKQKLLLNFIKAEVIAPHVSAATSVAFKLLQAMLARSVELEELYDFIITVSELMVTSEVEDIQKQCSAAVYTFLYNYKLGPNRMQTHLGFLLNQLNYPHATGRMSVLNLLNSIFAHFHSAVLEDNFEFLFLPLVVHMSNETDAKNKKMVNQVVSTLLSKVSAAKQIEVIKMVYGWWNEEQPEAKQSNGKKNKKAALTPAAESSDSTEKSPQSQLLQFAALQIVCILIDLLKSNYTGNVLLTRSVTGLLYLMREKVWADEDMNAAEEDEADENEGSSTNTSTWRTLYMTLLAFEKLFRYVQPAVLHAQIVEQAAALPPFAAGSSDFFELLQRSLLYPHAWVRSAAARVVGFILPSIPLQSIAGTDAAKQVFAATILRTPNSLFRLAKASASQLASSHLTESLSDQVVKNLVWISVAANNIGSGNMWEEVEENEEEGKEEEDNVGGQEEMDGEEGDSGAEEEAEDTKSDDEEKAEDVEMEDASTALMSKKDRKKLRQQQQAAADAAAVSSAKTGKKPNFPKCDNRLLNWLFTRLSYMCRKDEGVRMREAIFRYFATMSSQLPNNTFQCFLLQVLNPLYRLTNGQPRPDETELKAFAESVIELLQKSVGTTVFMTAYTYIRAQVQAVRQKRQVRKKQLALLHPDVAANRKQAKHELKRAAKKRKIQLLKSGRGKEQQKMSNSAIDMSEVHTQKKQKF